MPKMLKSRARRDDSDIPDSNLRVPCPHPNCDKTLSRKNDLRRHIKTHTREGAHKCPYSGCNKSMLQKGNLETHITAVHENGYPYKCPDCSKGFKKGTLWRMHRQQYHGYVPQVRNYRNKVVAAPKPKRTARKPVTSKRVDPYVKTRDLSQSAESTPSLSSGWSPSPSESVSSPSPSLSFDNFSLVKRSEADSIPNPSLFWRSSPSDNDKKPVFMEDSLFIEDVIHPTRYQTLGNNDFMPPLFSPFLPSDNDKKPVYMDDSLFIEPDVIHSTLYQTSRNGDFMEEQQLVFPGNDSDCTSGFEAQMGFYTLQEPSPANNFGFQGFRDTVDNVGWNDGNFYQQPINHSFQVPAAVNDFDWDFYSSGQLLPIQNQAFPEHGINESLGLSSSAINSAQFNDPFRHEFYF